MVLDFRTRREILVWLSALSRPEAVLVHVPFIENMSTAFEAVANKMSDSLKALA